MTPEANNIKAVWDRYAAIWSLGEDKRNQELKGCLSEDATYSDPASDILDVKALSEYMAGFQSTFPNCRFQINKAQLHHGRTLAQWDMVDADGTTLQQGVSHVLLADDGKFKQISGFFDLPQD